VVCKTIGLSIDPLVRNAGAQKYHQATTGSEFLCAEWQESEVSAYVTSSPWNVLGANRSSCRKNLENVSGFKRIWVLTNEDTR
jgi:hypothetical protein